MSLTKGRPELTNGLDDNAISKSTKLNLSLSKSFTRSATPFKALAFLLGMVAALAIAVALVLALVIATEEGDRPISITNAPTEFSSQSPTFFPTAPTSDGECETTPVLTEIGGQSDYITLVFTSCPSAATFNAYKSAAKRWNEIIAQNTIIPVSVAIDIDIQIFCPLPGDGYTFPAFYSFDHLVIFAVTNDIDGVGGTIVQSLACLVDDAFNFKPVIGVMYFDTADLALSEADGSIFPVITHEMGHVLGIGKFFPFILQDGGATEDISKGLAQDLVFNPNTGAVNPDNHPFFTGVTATAEFATLSGVKEPSVPLEDGRDSEGDLFFNVSNGEGEGSIDVHWKSTTFDNELMTYQIDASQPDHPLSAVTIASLQDMGYVVNLDKADSYELPAKKSLRKPQERASHILDLSGDVLTTTKDVKTLKSVFEVLKKDSTKP